MTVIWYLNQTITITKKSYLRLGGCKLNSNGLLRRPLSTSLQHFIRTDCIDFNLTEDSNPAQIVVI